MAGFTSKLQYKDYEKGEFSDEQERDLTETLKLIKDFPWDAQRGADVEIGGPGVIIASETGEYLKAGLFFNGKFCIYYLDTENHLYEYHTDNLEDVYKNVTGYFNMNLNIEGYEKHFFSIGNRSNFVNKTFEYTINPVLVYMRFAILAILGFVYFLLFLLAGKNMPIIFLCFIVIIGSLFIFLGYVTYRVYSKSKNMTFRISRGSDSFWFSNNGDEQEYSKKDIAEVNIYGRVSGKGKQILTIMEINFKNGQTIKFPGLLIDPVDFVPKVLNKAPVNYFEQFSFFRRSVWNF